VIVDPEKLFVEVQLNDPSGSFALKLSLVLPSDARMLSLTEAALPFRRNVPLTVTVSSIFLAAVSGLNWHVLEIVISVSPELPVLPLESVASAYMA
jgi:hypothetical protein